MDLEMEGRVALVTGAGQGVGREIAKVLSAEGVKVAINDLFEEKAKAVEEEIRGAGGIAHGLRGDVTDLDQVRAMVGEVVDILGPVDILVNNAGVPIEVRSGEIQRKSFADGDILLWEKQIRLNLFGCFNCTYSVLESMIKRREGKILSIISEAGRIGQEGLVLYGAAKAGILGFTKSLAREVGTYRINANCIAVGAAAHEGTKPRLDPDATPETDPMLKKMLKAYPIGRGLGRIGRPSDVAHAVAFLSSPKSCFITGQCLSVSGGFTMVG